MKDATSVSDPFQSEKHETAMSQILYRRHPQLQKYVQACECVHETVSENADTRELDKMPIKWVSIAARHWIMYHQDKRKSFVVNFCIHKGAGIVEDSLQLKVLSDHLHHYTP